MLERGEISPADPEHREVAPPDFGPQGGDLDLPVERDLARILERHERIVGEFGEGQAVSHGFFP